MSDKKKFRLIGEAIRDLKSTVDEQALVLHALVDNTDWTAGAVELTGDEMLTGYAELRDELAEERERDLVKEDADLAAADADLVDGEDAWDLYVPHRTHEYVREGVSVFVRLIRETPSGSYLRGDNILVAEALNVSYAQRLTGTLNHIAGMFPIPHVYQVDAYTCLGREVFQRQEEDGFERLVSMKDSENAERAVAELRTRYWEAVNYQRTYAQLRQAQRVRDEAVGAWAKENTP